MPRLSTRRKREREALLRYAATAGFRIFMRIIDPGWEYDVLYERMVAASLEEYQQAQSLRYGVREPYRSPDSSAFHRLLRGDPRHPYDFGSTRQRGSFVSAFRMSRRSFKELVRLTKDHPVFQRANPGRQQIPPAFQLLVLLKYLGTDGSGASYEALSHMFHISTGSVKYYLDRALKAVRSLKDTYLAWPNAQKREAIAKDIREIYNFPNCVGLIDGTLLRLNCAPGGEFEPSAFWSRKCFYALQMLVICDHNCRVHYIHLGWPGSVHDNRVWRNCQVHRDPGSHFSDGDILLADSAFTSGPHLIPAYRSNATTGLADAGPNQIKQFNEILARPRVKSEHCIGRLKGRFPWLKCIRCQIRNTRDLRKAIQFVEATVILHNWLIDAREENWDEDPDDDAQDAEPAEELVDDLEVDEPEAQGEAHGVARREQVLTWLMEERFITRQNNNVSPN